MTIKIKIHNTHKGENIMTTYKTTTYETSEDLRNAINSDLEQLAYPFTVRHRTYGEGQLTFIKAPLIGGSLYATVDFAAGNKTLALDVILASRLLEMPEILRTILLEAQTAFKADFIEREEAQRLADRQAREQAAEDKKKAEEDKKAEEKYQRARAKALKDFETRAQTVSPVSAADEFYYSLGWLAKHAGTVAAVLPDYLADAFAKCFGNETPCRIVDSKKRSPAGWQQQWSWSFTVSLKKPECVPATIAQHLNPAGNKVSDISFVWDLVEKYGFQFGKKQDLDKIRSHVPSTCIASFEAGLA
jgi:hypothetical protein